MRQYKSFIRDSLVIRRLLGESHSENLANLYWYGLPLTYVVSNRGMLTILLRHLLKKVTGLRREDTGSLSLPHQHRPSTARPRCG